MSFQKEYVDKYEHAQMDRPSTNTYRVNEKYQRDSAFASFAINPNLQTARLRANIV